MKSVVKKAAFSLALVQLAACSGAGNTSNLPTSAASSAKSGSPSASHLQYQVFTAGQTPGFPAGAVADDITPGPNQTMWFTDEGTPAIGKISSGGTITEYTAGLPSGAAPNAIVAGPDGNMWFSDYRGAVIGKVTSDGTITEYAPKKSLDTHAKGITFGSDGRPWIVAAGVDPVLARLTPQGTISVQHLVRTFTPDGA